ncbi:hypothetical protein [Capnocytophaga sp.]|uniref:hypothetical protein n=1 Tax=Capnocytophaga sp. TaxID=44737 RepID=UPI0026DB9036|nr:hypothetical protein [Capnocytophaga sp.]MDO5104283.1 hypothetical protein [Capnocytophaga sp.]
MKLFFRYLLLIISVTALTYGALHTLTTHYNLRPLLDIRDICLLHLSLSVCVLSIICTINIFLKKHTAYAFLATAFIRMGAIVLFVLPLAKKTIETPVTDVLFVVIPYFIFTVIEALFTIKLLKKQTS